MLGGSASRWTTVLVLAALTGLFLVHAATFAHYVNDDAYITFRYSHFLAAGQGPYFNPGERVEGYTNYLLMVIVALAIRLGGDSAAPVFAKGVGLFAGAGCVVVAYRLVREVRRGAEEGEAGRIGGFLAAGLLAAAPGYALNSVSGLETALFSFFVSAGVLLSLVGEARDGWRGAGLAFAAAALTRPEGALVFAVAWLARAAGLCVDLARERRLASVVRAPWLEPGTRRLLLDGLIVTACVGAHLAYRLSAYDGEWLPNTYYAKLGGFGKVTPWQYFVEGALGPFLGIGGLLAALAGFLGCRRALGASAVLLAAAAVGVAEPFWAGVDWMPGWRLVVPYLPLLAAAVAVGWSLFLERVLRRSRRAALLAFASLPAVWVVQEPVRLELFADTLTRSQGYRTGHQALAEWVGSEATPGDTVALMDVGIVGFLCPHLKILDVSGLTDRHIARSSGRFLEKRYDVDYVLGQRPRYVVLVLTAPGEPYRPPAPGTVLTPWTPMEDAISRSSEFQRSYPRSGAIRPGLVWPADFAAAIGAERIFEHGHPRRHYLLALFRRRDDAS